MKIITIYLPLLIVLTSCFGSGGEGGSSPVSAESVQDYLDKIESTKDGSFENSDLANGDSESSDSVVDQQDESTTASVDTFKFNRITGQCLNASNIEGFNADVFSECGDLSSQRVEGADFKSKNYWKLNLSDSVVSDSELNFNKIAKYEVIYNENTIFDDVKYFFTKLYNQHIKHIDSQKNKMQKNSDKVTILKEELDSLIEDYENETDPTVQKQLAKQIKKKNKQIQKHKKSAQFAMNKMYRHQNLSKKTFFMADGEPQLENPKVKNKKWLSIESMNDSRQIMAGSSLMNDQEFSVSVWFRTENESNSEARIYNALHSGNDSSLILGVQKNKLFFGYRDQEKKYHRSDFPFSYSDGEWHNIIVSFHDNEFLLFADGEKIGFIQDTYLGFGSEYTTLGSYKLKNHIFQGDIDEVSAWSQAFSLDDAQSVFNEGVPTQLKYHIKYSSLLRWWRMGDKASRSIAGELVD